MFSKIKVAYGLLSVLIAFSVLQIVTAGLGFWSMARTHDDVIDLTNVALQVNAVDETTRHLINARIDLSRAATRMTRGGAEPKDIVQHARGQIVEAERSFVEFSKASKVNKENGARTAALSEQYQKRFCRNKEIAIFASATSCDLTL